MTQLALESSKVSDYARLVRVDWGGTTPTFWFTDWTSNLTVGGNVHTAIKMSADVGKLTITTEEEASELLVPVSVSPFTRLARNPFRGKVEVEISDVSPSDLSNPRVLYRGVVSRVQKNYEGNENACLVTVDSMKSYLKRHVGVVASRTDAFPLEHEAHGLTIASLQLSGTVTQLQTDGKLNRITVSFGGSPDLSNGRWSRGYMDALGERVMIRKSFADGRFEMDGVIDQDWNGATVTATPGWDGSIEQARASFSAEGLESTFCGVGYAMADRNPLFETASQS